MEEYGASLCENESDDDVMWLFHNSCAPQKACLEVRSEAI